MAGTTENQYQWDDVYSPEEMTTQKLIISHLLCIVVGGLIVAGACTYNALKQVRKSAVLNVREAARNIGISPATLSRVENGKPPDIFTFAKICRWADLDFGTALKKLGA